MDHTKSIETKPNLSADKESDQQQAVDQFLSASLIPLRIACIDAKQIPMICSLWYIYDGESLWCATHKNAYICKLLQQNPACGFEVAVNDMPYRGVRGQGHAELFDKDGEEILQQLINRYHISHDSKLARWLLSRAPDEVAIRIQPKHISHWDFSERMADLSH